MRDLEAKENWLAARIDELKCDNLFCIKMAEKFNKSWIAEFDEYMDIMSKRQAALDYEALMRDLEDERINAAREY